MKILVLTNLYPPEYIGGYELICQTVVETLRERGHEILVLTSDHGVQGSHLSGDESDIFRRLEINGLYGHPWHGLRELRLLETRNNAVLRESIAAHKPDLVYVWNMGGLSKSMLLTLQRLGIPTVYYLSDHWIKRGLPADVWLRWWNQHNLSWPRHLCRRVLELSGARRRWDGMAPTNPIHHLAFQRIYFCSRALRDLTVAAGFDVRHGAVIYCPVHPRYFRDGPAPADREVRRLLYVGRLAEDKGVMTALRALAILREKFDGHLDIVGRGEQPYVNSLRTFVQEQHLPVNFTTATLEQMPQVYAAHDLLLFTSEWEEPFALTPIEAMASGLPVVGTTTGGSAELFRDRENGLVYPAGDASQLAACIWEFVADPVLRRRCALTGFSEARQRYAAPVIGRQIEEYLEETVRTWRPTGLPRYDS